MIKRLYSWLYNITSRRGEKGEYSGGLIQSAIRDVALNLCVSRPGDRALEIGTGSGLFLMKLASKNPLLKIWSIDTSDERLDAVAKKIAQKSLVNIHLLRQNAQETSFDDDYFDLVVCINLFLDMDKESVIRVLKEMKRVSRASGRIIFEFRNSRNALFRLKYRAARFYDSSAPYPLYLYDPDRIAKILDDLDLEVIGNTHLGFPVKRFAPIIILEARKRC
jgi:ubiquinone/menaquinone biosynthesis C-methylase UbiE